MRTDITSGILGQLPVSGAWYGYLLEITQNDDGPTVLRYNNFGKTFPFDSQTWDALDFTLPDISWDGTILRTGKLIVADAKLVFWVKALDGLLTDARVRIWAAYGDVENEAAAIWSGRIGQMTRNASALTTEISLTTGSDTESSPRTRIQAVVNPVFLIPGGTILNIGGQQWVINRPTSAAG